MGRRENSFRSELGGVVYTSAPASKDGYLGRLREAAVMTESAGCDGMLVYSDNGTGDPWAIAQLILDQTSSLVPLVATQPVYSHPFTVANTVATLWEMYGRRVDLNLVAGGFPIDLLALGDQGDHDARYERLTEFATVVNSLLTSDQPTEFLGAHYAVRHLSLRIRPPGNSASRFCVSGSSEGGKRCAQILGAVAIEYPEPHRSNAPAPRNNYKRGLRVGLIARATADAAWDIALARFPDDEEGRRAQRIISRESDSSWLRRLGYETGDEGIPRECTYWLGPLRMDHTFCPYLVGSYQDVASWLAGYFADGHRLVILDQLFGEDDLADAMCAVDLAARMVV